MKRQVKWEKNKSQDSNQKAKWLTDSIIATFHHSYTFDVYHCRQDYKVRPCSTKLTWWKRFLHSCRPGHLQGYTFTWPKLNFWAWQKAIRIFHSLCWTQGTSMNFIQPSLFEFLYILAFKTLTSVDPWPPQKPVGFYLRTEVDAQIPCIKVHATFPVIMFTVMITWVSLVSVINSHQSWWILDEWSNLED